jgi:hypothetical protein
VWKLGLRVSCVVLAIIGIGCMGWAVATSPPYGPYTYELSDQLTLSWTLITFGVSAIWCSICILVLLIRKRPCHPGVAVGMDLLLWLAFIPTAMLALMGVISIARFGIDGEIGRYSSYGSYELAINGTWIWNATEYDTYFQNSRDCSLDGSYTKQYNDYGFDSCEEEDAYVNALWAAKPNRMRVEITGTVCQFLGFFLHFALFVWACVDTHRRNRRKVSRDAERLAGDIVMKMVRSGAVIPPQNQPAGPYQQIPDAYQRGAPYGGGWPIPGPAPMARGPPQQMMPMARGPPQQMMPPPPQWLNPPMPEKGDSARFA